MEQEQPIKTEAEKELEQQHDKYGRKTVVTPSVVVKLEQAFAMGCTDLEACFYAGIGKSSLYRYEDNNPEFRERKDELKSKPILLARQTVMKGIVGHEIKDENGNVVKVILAPDPKLALDYLKNKQHREFKAGIETTDNTVHDSSATSNFLARFGKKQKEKEAYIAQQKAELNGSNLT